AERAAAAVRYLDALVARGVTGPVRRQYVEGLVAIGVDQHDIFTILPDDVDELAGETLDAKSLEAETQLERALAEGGEARSPERLLSDGVHTLLATGIFALALVLLVRAHRAAVGWLAIRAAARIQKRLGRPVTELGLVSRARLLDLMRRFAGAAALAI